MVRRPSQDKYHDREAGRTKQETENHFVNFRVHLACFLTGRPQFDLLLWAETIGCSHGSGACSILNLLVTLAIRADIEAF